jgi:dTDP-4-dehydrorhamnose 3,5-epimerase
MKLIPTPVTGAWVIDQQPRTDERGFFARAFCVDELGAAGLHTNFVQINNAFTNTRGTLRGFHYQLPPFAEVKIFRCIRGSLFDMIVDLRPDSPSYRKACGVTLTAENRRQLYIPRGCAHAYLTLEDNSEALYLSSAPYAASAERGLRYDDPMFALAMPVAPTLVSPKDATWPDFDVTGADSVSLTGLMS